MLPHMNHPSNTYSNTYSNAYSNAFPTNHRNHSSISVASTTSSFSTGNAQTHGIAEYRHATPPSHNDRALPSTPSSARLRRVAPSPLRIAGSSRLRFSPESPTSTAQTRDREGGIRGRQLHYNLGTFAQVVAEANRAKMGPPISRGQAYGQGRGQAGLGASMSTRLDPERQGQGQGQEDDDGELKEDWTKLTREEWIRANIPREVLVNFRTDVFGPGPQSPTEEDGAGPAAHTYSPDSQSRFFPCTDRVTMHGSFATFGRRRSESQSRGSVVTALTHGSGQGQGHGRRETATSTDAFSISMYDRDDNRHHHDQPRSPTDTGDNDWNNPQGVEVPLIFPGYTEDSPASINTELVTPEQDHPPTLPRHDSEDEDEEDTPTKPKVGIKHKASNNALLLSFHDDAFDDHGRGPQPQPEIELEQEEDSWRKANAGVTPAARSPKQAQDQGSGESISVYPPPPVPPLPSVRVSPPPTNSDSGPNANSSCSSTTASASFSTTTTSDSSTTVKLTKSTSTNPSDELANFNHETYIEISVDNGPGQTAYKTTLPFRRISRPEVWQGKEEAALQRAWKWNERPAKPQPFQQTGCVIFGQPPRHRDKWVFGLVDHGTDHDDEDCPHANEGANADSGGGRCGPLPIPSIRTVNVGGDSTRDYMTNHVDLDIEEYGVYNVSGNDKFGRVQWQFEYLVIHQTNYQGDILPNQRIVCPMHFYAATSFFDCSPPAHSPTSIARRKSKRSSLVSERMDPPRLGTPPKIEVTKPKPKPVVLTAPVLTRNSPKSPPRTGPRHREIERDRDGNKDRHERCESSPPQQLRPEIHRHVDARAVRSALSSPVPPPLATGTGIDTSSGAEADGGTGTHLIPEKQGVCISTTVSTGKTNGNTRFSRKSPPSGSAPLTGSSGSESASGSGCGSGSGRGGVGSGEKTGGGGIVSGFLHKFGAKSKSSGRSTPKSQATSPALPHDPTVHPPEKTGYSRAESVESSKTTRARATSLLSRMTRPFTPPTNSVFDLSLSNSMSKDLPPNPPIPSAHAPTQAQAQAQGNGRGQGHKPKLAPMRSLASLRPNTPPRFNNSPPVPAIPAGLILVRPPPGRPGSRSNSPSSLSNLVNQHPLTTALRQIDPPSNSSNSNSNSNSQSSDSIVNMSGATATPKHYITISTKDKIRPVSSNYDPQAVYLGLGFGGGDHNNRTGNGAGGQENAYPPYGQHVTPTPGGLHPPRRPNLRKRPSTADPIVNPSGRLLSTRDSPQCL